MFTHASVHIDPGDAVALIEEVRRRTGAGTQELKASRLNRSWALPVTAWLCAPDGPLQGRAVVHLTDTRLFGLARLAQVLKADSAPEGWWSPREEPESWAQALRLHAVLDELPTRWEREVLVSARNLLWIRRRRRYGEPVETWVDVVRSAADRLPDDESRRFLAAWASPQAVQRAHDHLAAPPASPLSEPLLPALRWTVRHWSALGDVFVVHDEQSVLTPARVAAIADELAASRPGGGWSASPAWTRGRTPGCSSPTSSRASYAAAPRTSSRESGASRPSASTTWWPRTRSCCRPTGHRSRLKNVSQPSIASGTS